jgi:hypothetical protein
MLSRSRVLLKRARQSARPMPKYSFLLLSFLDFQSPSGFLSIPSPDSFAYKIASEIRKYGNIPHIITCVIRLYFRDSNLPFDSELD